MENLFAGKVALVTGGGSGIGESIAMLYGIQGAKVVVADMNEAGGNTVVANIKTNGGEAIFVNTDVSNPTECEQLVKTTVATYGRLDMAFNNAGIGGEPNAIADMSIEGWQKVIAVNLNSVFYCMKYQIGQMLTQETGGAIVNMASILGAVGFATAAGYVAAKHGVVGLTQNAALEYSAKGIRINTVAPGFIETPLLKDMDGPTKDFLAQQHPIGRLGKPEEVAELVCWLTSIKASFVTGGYYPVDGGYLAK